MNLQCFYPTFNLQWHHRQFIDFFHIYFFGLWNCMSMKNKIYHSNKSWPDLWSFQNSWKESNQIFRNTTILILDGVNVKCSSVSNVCIKMYEWWLYAYKCGIHIQFESPPEGSSVLKHAEKTFIKDNSGRPLTNTTVIMCFHGSLRKGIKCCTTKINAHN